MTTQAPEMGYLIDTDEMKAVAASLSDDYLELFAQTKIKGHNFCIVGPVARQFRPFPVKAIHQLYDNMFPQAGRKKGQTRDELMSAILSHLRETPVEPVKASTLKRKANRSTSMSENTTAETPTSERKLPVRPKEGSKTRQVWDIADDMPESSRAEVLAACAKAGLNKSTAATQYQNWKQVQDSLAE